MSNVYDFLRDCGTFFVLTMNGDCPAGRPFGAVMEYDGALYISTADMKAVYRQLKSNPNVQLLALKYGTRSWMRITGKSAECSDMRIKERMLESCPVLAKHFPAPDAPHYVVFRIDIDKIEKY